MTFDFTLFSSCTSSKRNRYNTVANGSYACVDGSRNVNLLLSFQLQFVAAWSHTFSQLISIHKLIRDHKYKVTFFS